MPIPDYQSIMLPVLEFLGDDKSKHRREVMEYLAKRFELTEEEKLSRLLSGSQTTFGNRMDWASTHLVKAGLLERPSPGYLRITIRGQTTLAQQPQSINRSFLQQFEEYRSGWGNSPPPEVPATIVTEDTPEEKIDKTYHEIRQALVEELLDTVKRRDPWFFQHLIVGLMVKMGYGSPRTEGPHLKLSGDEGIDGIIDQDTLGLDTIYLQAKRWSGNVGRPDIQKFVGALQGQKARKGVFITTSSFTNEAKTYAADTGVVLIDGVNLAQFMIDHDVGVTTVQTYAVKRINLDYFPDEALEG